MLFVKTNIALSLFYIKICSEILSLSNCEQQHCGYQKVESSNASTTSSGEFPWTAALTYENVHGDVLRYRCLGSLIAPRYVLTTATCAAPGDSILTEVRLGAHDRTVDIDCETEKCLDETFDIENTFLHREYQVGQAENDIALLRLDRDVVYTDSVQPICLPTFPMGDPSDVVFTTGWGMRPSYDYATTKKKVVSLVMADAECATIGKIKNVFCTRALATNKDFVCAGDRGGPVMMYDAASRRWYLTGIVVYQDGCDEMSPEVNLRVSNYLESIYENM